MRRWKVALLRTAVLAFLALGAVLGAVALQARTTSPAVTSAAPAAVPRPAAQAAGFVWSAPGGIRALVRHGCPQPRLPEDPPPALRDFPFPAGATIFGTRHSALAGARVIDYAVGYVPLSLERAASRLRATLPKSGYRETGGDAEPWEVEATFRGHGRRGAWKLNRLSGCEAAVAFLIGVVSPAPARES